ncbi:unnamed protein product [Closterium sp. NIES-65]|nr:unnamed protein product [Closterium sp. NIES-65]
MMLPASQILVPLLLQDFDINWKPSSPPNKRARLREFKHCIPHDGHEWLKYGQKDISGGRFSRHYFRCSHSDNGGRRCPARRVVDVHTLFGQPGASDIAPRVIYSGKHNHAQPASRTPSENESLLTNPTFPTERANLTATGSMREQLAITGHMFPLPRAQLQHSPCSEKRQHHATTLDLSVICSGLAKEDGERCDNSCPLTPTTPSSPPPLSPPLSAPLSPQSSPAPSTPVSPRTPLWLWAVSSSSVIPPSPGAAAEEAEQETGELHTGLANGKRKWSMLVNEAAADDMSRADVNLKGCQGFQVSEVSLGLNHGILLPSEDLDTNSKTPSEPLDHGVLLTAADWASASNNFDTFDLSPLQGAPIGTACPNGAPAALPKSGALQQADAFQPRARVIEPPQIWPITVEELLLQLAGRGW